VALFAVLFLLLSLLQCFGGVAQHGNWFCHNMVVALCCCSMVLGVVLLWHGDGYFVAVWWLLHC